MPSNDKTELQVPDLPSSSQEAKHADKDSSSTRSSGQIAPAVNAGTDRTETTGPGSTPATAAGSTAEATLAQTVPQLEKDVVRAKALSHVEIDLGLATGHLDELQAKTSSTSSGVQADDDLATELQTSSARRIAERISKGTVPGYQILEKIGEGTYGVVYRALDENTGVEVAIKFFEKIRSQHWQMVQAEVEQLARLQADAGIVQLRKVDPDAIPPYYVMALAEKGCLAKTLQTRKKLPLEEALPLFRQVVETLAYVHAKGIRHCDLKPGNILLDARGRARVGDFGQAHLSSDDSPTLGTFFYMAPEQANLSKQIPDTRWDVYGLGALLYAMVTGHPPRQTPEVRDLLCNTADLSHRLQRYRTWVEVAPAPREHYQVTGMYRPLATLIDHCLDCDPDKRPRDAATVLVALNRCERQKRQKPILLFALIAPILLLVFLSALALGMARHMLEDYRVAREKRVGESNLALARLAAFKIETQLRERVQLLEKDAQDLELRRLVKARNEKQLTKTLGQMLNNAGQGAEQQKDYLSGMWVLEATGTMLAIVPHDPKVVSVNYSWRDYFNGNRDYPEDRDNPHKRYPPIQRSYLSQPFVGTAKDIGLVLAVSTPVFDPEDNRRVVGVLAASIKIESLAEWLWELNKIHNVFAVLINNRKNVLFHEQQALILPEQFQRPKVWGEPGSVFDKVLQGDSSHEVYVDPVDQKLYVGGYSSFHPSPSTPEVVGGILVQHKYANVMEPVEELRRHMLFWGVIMLLTSCGLLVLMWLWLFRILRREEEIANA